MLQIAKDFAEALNDKFAEDGCSFTVEPGRRYAKIVYADRWGSRSVHAFVEIATGALLKAEGWKVPAKGVRFDLSTAAGFERAVNAADRFGGYLYLRH